MAALAVVFLAVFATEVLAQSLSSGWHQALVVADYSIWAIFAAEFLVRLTLAHPRGRYLLRHLPDVAMLALPFLRAMRVLRIVPLLRALNRWAADSLRGKFVVYGISSAVLLVFTGALAVLDAERGQPGATITTFGRALWWATVTITTVGYGDYAPITAQGKVIAAGLMLGGITLLGVVTASIASWFVEHIQGSEERHQREEASLREELGAVRAELAEVRAALAELRGASGNGSGAMNGHRQSSDTD
jgi:voltage-gated potassium channel